MAPIDSFPLETRVILQGLLKAPDLNGKVGIVRSGLTRGRQQVYIEELSKSVALKLSNLKLEGRSIDTLSVKELKTILKSKNVSDSELTGIDISDLKSKLSSWTDSPEEIADWLVQAQTAPSPSAASTMERAPSSVNPGQVADQLGGMSPDQLRQQARQMRSMDPASLRRMNTQLAHMTDAQIEQAASQMEMMADNPHMMKMAAEQMKNMSPDEIQRMQNQQMANGGMPSSRSASTTSTNSGTDSERAANMMGNMTPEQMKQQAEMFKTMDPDTIRRTNPQLAHMTDAQIKMAATQFEMMASNPEMMKMAMDQMKNLSPEQVENIKAGGGAPPDMNQMGGDPAKMLANMDKTQLKQMLNSLKDNPDMLKQFAGMSGMSEEQLAKGVDVFANMEDSKLDMAMSFMVKAQKTKEVWTQADTKTGGHLLKIVVLLGILFMALVVKMIFFRSAGIPVLVQASTLMEDIPSIATTPVVEDEFGGEF
jgi:hypothetical protein